jgi:hypothetical protein
LGSGTQATVRTRIAKDAAALADNENGEGVWSIDAPGMFADMGDTAMAVAALAEAARIVPPVADKTWSVAVRSLVSRQRSDGAWDYMIIPERFMDDRFPMPPLGSTVVNGLAGLLEVRDTFLGTMGCPCKGGASPTAADLTAAIDRGLQALESNLRPNRGGRGDVSSAEWIFFAARTGQLSAYKRFGKREWYPDLAARALGDQADNGSWTDAVGTGLNLAALAGAREAVLVNKLRFDGSWNNHPRDAANMAAHVAARRKEPLRAQVLYQDAALDELHEAPILYLTAESPAPLGEDQKKRLREFTDTGGTILLEASCGNTQAAKWCEELARELWPEWELKPLGRSHPLWTADARMTSPQPLVKGVDDGLRVAVFYVDYDLSCPWSLGDARKTPVAFDLAVNLAAYATDGAPLKSRRLPAPPPVDKYASQAPKAGERSTVRVARVRHGGDWNVGANYRPWDRLASALKAAGVNLSIQQGEPLVVGQPLPDQAVDLAFLTGRQSCILGDGGDRWLKDTLAARAFLWVEAALGDRQFDESFRAVAASAGLVLKPFGTDSPLVTGRIFDVTGYAIASVAYTPALSTERAKAAAEHTPAAQEPRPAEPAAPLLGIYDRDRLIGVYSPWDVLFSQTGYTAFGNRGYAAEDARAIATNILLLAAVRSSVTTNESPADEQTPPAEQAPTDRQTPQNNQAP